MTQAEAATIRRDVPRIGCRAVADLLSTLAEADGRRAVTHEWVRSRAQALGVATSTSTARTRDAYAERDAVAGRLHASGLPVSEVARRTGTPAGTVTCRLRRYYDRLGVPRTAWHRRGQRADLLSA